MPEVEAVKYLHDSDAQRLEASLREIPPPLAKPVLVVVSGLPGSGKSYFSRRLVEKVPLLILETDVLRRVLFPQPTYSGVESARLFRACHTLIENLLRKGIPILLDATNLIEAHREYLYHIVDRTGAKLILVYLTAPPEVIYQRLQGRLQEVDPEDHSSADWQVYQRMSTEVEPFKRNHYVVDTSKDISPALAKIFREINRWMRTV